MKCTFCNEEFDARFNIGDSYEGLQICPHCRMFNQVKWKMGRAILKGFKTVEEAEIYLQGLKDGRDLKGVSNERLSIIDDREYNGEWTVNLE